MSITFTVGSYENIIGKETLAKLLLLPLTVINRFQILRQEQPSI